MYSQKRNRILRQSQSVRSLVAETQLTADDFIVPLFIDEGENMKIEIPSMPGYYRNTIDFTIKEVKELWNLGIKSVLLFIKESRSAAGFSCCALHAVKTNAVKKK